MFYIFPSLSVENTYVGMPVSFLLLCQATSPSLTPCAGPCTQATTPGPSP